jgi:predicted DNA-binding transcriptional regulator AlpA
MKIYDFTLKFALPDPDMDPEEFIGLLAKADCEDALVGIGQKGRIALNFTREAKSAAQAVLSALQDVKRAIPEAKLVEASPDFVGLTDVAQFLGCSRQNVRKVVIRYGASFPAPVHEGNPAIWRLAKVLSWIQSRGREIDRDLLEVAQATQQVNLAREMQDAVPAMQKKVQALFA